MRGQISLIQLIGWGVAIGVPSLLASIGFSNAQINKLEDIDTQTVQRITKIETESVQYQKDIAEINKKLDLLLTKLK